LVDGHAVCGACDDAVMSSGMRGTGTWYGSSAIWRPALLAVTALNAELFIVLHVKK
jgi:hypothetical protein